MTDQNREQLSKSRLTALRENWSEPDRLRDHTWDFDGVFWGPEDSRSYDYEMRQGLGLFGCKTFDRLVLHLKKQLGRKPTVVDLMGGAYFLEGPQNTQTLVGIRIHPKDKVFLEASAHYSQEGRRDLYRKIISAPNRQIIEADILSNAGWQTILRQNLAPADLLVCRPMGPFDDQNAMASRFDDPKFYAGLYVSLFARMLKLVNRTSGVVFCEIPDVYTEEQAVNFFRQVDIRESSRTEVFTVPDRDYHWGKLKRRYVVMRFGGLK